MAYSIYRSAGTSELSFQIGLTGLTIYQGTGDPNSSPPINPSGGPFVDGDLYFRNNPGSMAIYAYDTGSWAVISGGAAVTSFGPLGFPRTGDVNPAAGDYDADQVDYDDTATSLPGSPTNVQAAIEALDGRLDALGGPFLEIAGGTMLGDITMNAGVQHLADGAASFTYPAYAFDTDDQSGMYSPAVSEIGFATNSALRMKVIGSGLMTAETAGYTDLVRDDVTGKALVNKEYVDTRPIPYDMAFYAGGPMAAADDIVGGMVITRTVRIETDAPGSKAKALVSGHASDAVYTFEVDGSPIGTVTFPSGSPNGVFSMTATNLALDNVFTMKTPNPIVSGIEDVMVTISGCARTITCDPDGLPPMFSNLVSIGGNSLTALSVDPLDGSRAIAVYSDATVPPDTLFARIVTLSGTVPSWGPQSVSLETDGIFYAYAYTDVVAIDSSTAIVASFGQFSSEVRLREVTIAGSAITSGEEKLINNTNSTTPDGGDAIVIMKKVQTAGSVTTFIVGYGSLIGVTVKTFQYDSSQPPGSRIIIPTAGSTKIDIPNTSARFGMTLMSNTLGLIAFENWPADADAFVDTFSISGINLSQTGALDQFYDYSTDPFTVRIAEPHLIPISATKALLLFHYNVSVSPGPPIYAAHVTLSGAVPTVGNVVQLVTGTSNTTINNLAAELMPGTNTVYMTTKYVNVAPPSFNQGDTWNIDVSGVDPVIARSQFGYGSAGTGVLNFAGIAPLNSSEGVMVTIGIDGFGIHARYIQP